MLDNGPSLEKWQLKITPKERKLQFVIQLLSQITGALKKLHFLGYSHNDLKFENICAQECQDGDFNFTLIDLGMNSKLPFFNQDKNNIGQVKGNLMFATADHLIRKRSSQIDDILSLLYVAYYFIYDTLPWIDFIDTMHEKQFIAHNGININFYETEPYT